MKNFKFYKLTALLFLINYSHLFSQTPYYDALILKDEILTSGTAIILNQNDDVFELLNLYSIHNNPDQQALMAEFLDNPFLKIDTSGFSTFHDGDIFDKAKPILTSFSGINITNFADGLTRHIITSAKEELNIAFFSRLKKFSQDNPEFRTLFPESFTILEDLLSHEYHKMIPILQEAFLEDSRNIIYTIDDLLELPRYSAALEEFPEVRIAIQSMQVIEKLEGEKHVTEILQDFSEMDVWKDDWDKLDKNAQGFYEVLVLTQTISNSLRFSDTTRAWLKKEEFEKLKDDALIRKIYLGLVYQDLVRQKKPTGSKIIEACLKFMKDVKEEHQYNLLIRDFEKIVSKIETVTKELKILEDSVKKPSNDQLYEYIDLSIDVLEYGRKLALNFDGNLNLNDNFITILNDANSAFKAVYQKNYTSAIFHAINVLKTVSVSNVEKIEKFESILKKVNKLPDGSDLTQEIRNLLANTSLVAVTDKTTAKTNLEKIIASKKIYDFLEKGYKYIMFIANFSDAESPEAAQKAIEAVALPTGSSSYKKHQRFNISISSYLGAAYSPSGIEENLGINDTLVRSWNKEWNVTMPVGIGFNWGLGKAGSITLLGNILDLGAIAEFRLKEDTLGNKSLDENIVLGNILAPGGSLIYGFGGDLPLSLGFSYQYGPGLYKIEEDNDTGNTFNKTYGPSGRFSITLTIDVPLLNLHTSQKSRKIK